MKYLTFAFIFFSFMSGLVAREVPAVRPVVDQAGVLSRQVQGKLTSALIQIKKQTGNEIAVLIVPSLEDEAIESYSIKVVDQWKLGAKDADNGILFLIAVEDRKMRIEVGQGLEGDLPDARAGQIIRSIKPYFRKGDYQSGVILGVSEIANNIGVKLTNTPRVRNRRSKKGSSGLMLVIFFILSFLFRGRGSGGLITGLLLGSVLGGGRSSGGGGGFSGDGGFGSGGGFSGGGASGDW